MKKFKLIIGLMALISVAIFFVVNKHESVTLPLVAIANYGPHNTLSESIQGVKDALAQQGFVENKSVRFVIQDVGFDASLIPQMLTSLKNKNPQIIVAMTTPVAQFAKGSIHDIPIIYNVITDPIAAGLIQSKHKPLANITGSSDQQNVKDMLLFAKHILPKVEAVGLLYAPSEANDLALKKLFKKASKQLNIKLIARPIMASRDIALVMPQFKNKVDMIYVGASGPIQPALPIIAAKSKSMHIPVFNVDEDAVRKGLVLASFGVDYYQVGLHAGELVAHQLQHKNAPLLHPIYPIKQDHHALISLSHAKALNINVRQDLPHTTFVE